MVKDPSVDSGPDPDEETSGGVALGEMFADAVLGSSFGLAGTVTGALFSTMVGDELEKQVEVGE